MSLSPRLDLLSSINTALAYLGLQSINSFDESGDSEANLIKRIIDEETARVLRRGLPVNVRTLTLTPDSSDNILIPDSYLVCLPTEYQSKIEQIGDHLYDTDNNTDEFTSSVECQVHLNLDLEDLPQDIIWYITLSSAKKALVRFESSPESLQMLFADYAQAKGAYERYLLNAGDFTILDKIPGALNRVVDLK